MHTKQKQRTKLMKLSKLKEANEASRPGQALLEAVVAMGVLVTIAAAFAKLVLGSFEGGERAREQTIATSLAQEGLEVLRAISEQDFDSLADGTYAIVQRQGQYELTAPDATPGKYYREIVIAVDPEEPGRKRVTSTVTFARTGGRTGRVRLQTLFTSWRRPRWLTDLLREFSPGSLHATELTERDDGESSIAPGSFHMLSAVLQAALPSNAPVRDMEIDPIADRLYLVTANYGDGAEFFAYDLSNVSRGALPLLGSVDLKSGGTAVAAGEAYVYVATEHGTKKVQVIRLADFSVVANWDLEDAAVPVDIALDEERDRLYLVASNEAFHAPQVIRLSQSPRTRWELLLSWLRTLFPFWSERAFAQGAPTCNGLPATIYVDSSNVIVGGPDDGDEYGGSLDGTSGADVMVGTAGADTIDSKGGNDTVCGLDGNDTLKGGNGSDTLFGGSGVDTVQGKANTDTLYGGEGDDVLEGGNENDTLFGGSGDDTLDGQGHDDIACGEAGTDTLMGGSGDDQLDGGTGTDALDGEGQSDICQNGETLVSCEDISTAIPTCAMQTVEEKKGERDTGVPLERFYVLDVSDPEALSAPVLHESGMRSPRRVLFDRAYAYVITNSGRLPYLRIVSLTDYERIADCILREGEHANDIAIRGSRVFVAFDQSYEPEFVEYAFNPEKPADCHYLNAHATSKTEMVDAARALAVLPERELAFVVMGEGRVAVQTIDLANDDAPAAPLHAFAGVCDDIAHIGSYLFAGCRHTVAGIAVFAGTGSESSRFLHGTYTSAPFDAGREVVWNSIAWRTAGEGSVVLRTRTADTLENITAASWVGRDGTRATPYANPRGERLGIHPGSRGTRFIQWKAYFSGDGSGSSLLEDVTLTYE